MNPRRQFGLVRCGRGTSPKILSLRWAQSTYLVGGLSAKGTSRKHPAIWSPQADSSRIHEVDAGHLPFCSWLVALEHEVIPQDLCPFAMR